MIPGDAAWVPLAVGFTVGLGHAFEADHVAAVATIASRERGFVRAGLVGLWWAVGHTAALAAVATAALIGGWRVPEGAARGLEALVGVVLVGLGVASIAALTRGIRVHRHVHAHGGVVHEHFHLHPRGNVPHAHGPAHSAVPIHEHRHLRRVPRGSFGLGVLHGLAGSGAVVVLAIAAAETATARWLYLGSFGIGLLMAMTVLSVALVLPSRAGASRRAAVGRLRGLAGAASVVVGVLLMVESL